MVWSGNEMHNRDVLISEVGPRDGLQSLKRTMPTGAFELEAAIGDGRQRIVLTRALNRSRFTT
jgi:hypothetical protein